MQRRADRQLTLPLGALPTARENVAVRPEPRAQLVRGATQLADELARLLGERVKLAVTDNTSTMVSFRRSRAGVAFRVHHMFLEAPREVVEALAGYAAGARGAGPRIDAFVRRHEERVRSARAERQAKGLVPFGEVHDLQTMFQQLNRAFFGGAIEARIGWGRDAPDRRRRSIKMGTYFHDAKVIRIHPALDRPEVPDFFVRFIVFHEMLHQAVPPIERGGQRVAHTPEFRRRERAYPDYARAIEWERRHLSLLLGRQPKRVPFDPDDPLA